MAMEDALVLAGCLREQRSVEAAFGAYESLRRQRVERIVAQGARSGSAKIPGRFGRAVRDTMMRLLLRFVLTEKSLAWMYDYRVEWPAALQPAATPPPVPVAEHYATRS
jgi:2-polyprenyl-6-methoxyphenol hydroxylase-like FAD-dependent oxidoreductase